MENDPGIVSSVPLEAESDDFHLGAGEVQPAIFLSHSGKQKAFVEHLYNALQNANHTAFFDKHTLPKGSPFPSHINRAARSCKLGVVLLSDDFLTSKWPMLELDMLVLQRGPDAKVLPLFYKLLPQDLKSPKNLSEWRLTWEKKAPAGHADQWERAVKTLDSFNGEVFTPGTSEVAYIERVVHIICNLLPTPILHDLSKIQGHELFAEVVSRQFEKAEKVGLHGVGGLGKTTVCKIMANFYLKQYPGKSCHIEFPSDGDHNKIIQECKKALKILANLSDEQVLNKAHSFDQVVQLMRENLVRYDVFLAIDNIWVSSSEAAMRILGVGFSAKSKILLTSRSEQVLKDLLEDHSNSCIAPLPSPDREVAFQIFQETLGQKQYDLNSLENRDQLDKVLDKCLFSGSYHPLALKAVSQHLKRVCKLERWGKIADHLSLISEEIRNRNLEKVEDLIMLNYVNLQPKHKKHMFLDIVLVTRISVDEFELPNAQSRYAKACQMLSFLYKEYYSTSDIINLIYELALDGLIQLENIDGRNMNIKVHDLYSDLALREAASSSRFFTDGSTRSVEEIEWKSLERVILNPKLGDDNTHCFVHKLQQQQCQKLQVLYAPCIHFCSGIHLDPMKSLRLLKLQGGSLTSTIQHFNSITGVLNLNALVNLHILSISECESVERIEGLHTLKKLKALFVYDCPFLKNLDGLSGLLQLEFIRIGKVVHLKRMPDLSGLTCLEWLKLDGNEAMEEVGALSPALKSVEVYVCGALKKMPDLSGLTCLERLGLDGNKSLEEVGGLSPALKSLEVCHCGALKKMPDLSGLTCLERLKLVGNELVGGLSPSLKSVEFRQCGALKKMPDLSGLTCLERLELACNESMEEVGGFSPALKSVEVHHCGALKKMPNLSGLTCLEGLLLACNKSLEEVGGLSPALKSVEVYDCGALKKMPDLSGLTCLEWLLLACNKSLEEVGGLSPALKSVVVHFCGALKKMPDLSGLTCLERLELVGNKSMEEVGGLSPALKSVVVRGCGALKKMPDLSGLTCLERLELASNWSMEEVGGLSPALKSVEVCYCGALKKMPDLSGLTCLERLELVGNKSMEEVGGLSPALKSVIIKY